MPDDEDAVEAGEGLGSLAARGPLGSLAAAFEEGRQSGREERLKRKAGVDSAPFGLGHNPLKTLASRVRGVNKGSAEVSITMCKLQCGCHTALVRYVYSSFVVPPAAAVASLDVCCCRRCCCR